MFRILYLFVWLPFFALGQPQRAKQAIRQMKQVRFSSPVLVLIRLNQPVVGAEHRMVMERALLPTLDTLSLPAMLRHPGMYFAQVYTGGVPGKPYRKYYRTAPEVPDGLDPFQPTRFPFEPVEKPSHGGFYTRLESAEPYRYWMAQTGLTDVRLDDKANTLPGVDSIRTIYIIQVRPRFKRRISGHGGR